MTHKVFVRWTLVAVWMTLIFTGSTNHGSSQHTGGFIEPLLRWLLPRASSATIDTLHFYVRKCAHLTEYGILGVLVLRAFSAGELANPGENRWKRAQWALGISALYACSDEFHQIFVPSRGASVEDVLLDTCGAAMGIAALLLWRMRHDKKER